ncbi:MAG TPA: outer membrane protein assembly factor BamD [Phycisphaerae bacterium]|nr:outer membrane protein assembly factor BamD [Phycisphaerae bacterium]
MRKLLRGAAACGLVLTGCLAAAGADEYVWKDGKWVAAVKPAEGTPEGELALIRSYVSAGQRKEAVAAAERFGERYADNPLREEAMLLGGQAELDAERYYQAYEQFEAMLAAYPNGQFLERALTREMEVANAFLAGKKRIVGKVFRLPAKDEGLKILRGIVEHAPGAEIAERAMMRVGEHHFDNGDYADAAEAYDEYMQLFPRGRHTPEAMSRGARATYLSFQGVPYDQTPLVEAEHRYKALIDQHPAAAKKDHAEQVLREIAEIRAEQTYQTARFYQRTDRPESAGFYYRQVIQDYPASSWASAARAALGGKAPAAAPKPTPATRPAEPPAGAVKPTPEPAPAAKPAPPAEAKPARGPTTAPGPIDLEKLVDPSRKGESK